jgi:hypothetical protein
LRWKIHGRKFRHGQSVDAVSNFIRLAASLFEFVAINSFLLLGKWINDRVVVDLIIALCLTTKFLNKATKLRLLEL